MNKRIIGFDSGFDVINRPIQENFMSEKGPGEFPIEKRGKKTLGILAPYYSYRVSNAAWAYKEIAESFLPESYVILGRKSGRGFSTFLFSDWETPLGLIKTNKKYGSLLIKEYPQLKNDFDAFNRHQVIDVQLPWLQFANRKQLTEVKFVPILVGDVNYEEICEFADSFVGENICIIGSAHLTCYGKEYGFVPFVHAIKNNLYLLDRALLDLICALDTKGFLELGKKNNVFDRNVIALEMEVMRNLGCKKGIVLNHSTSGDFEGYEHSVGFGAVVFR